MKERWQRKESETLYDAGILRLRRDLYRYAARPDAPFYVLEAGPWINVVPVTPGGTLLLVRQFRHGIEDVTLEVPGGAMDRADPDPAAAARRELLEETGHAGDPPVLLGRVTCNPAILDNWTSCYLVENARKVAEQDLDPYEDVEVVERKVEEIPALLRSGEIHHALSLSALSLFWLSRGA